MLPVHHKVEERAGKTHRSGDRPLWEGYQSVKGYPRSGDTRKPDQVRSDAVIGRFYSWLAARRQEDVIVEFGTAFGVSGMYWLTGMSTGHLYTFEPNTDWAASAGENLRTISDRFTLTVDTFETVGPTLLAPRSVGIAFVDAIHTSVRVPPVRHPQAVDEIGRAYPVRRHRFFARHDRLLAPHRCRSIIGRKRNPHRSRRHHRAAGLKSREI